MLTDINDESSSLSSSPLSSSPLSSISTLYDIPSKKVRLDIDGKIEDRNLVSKEKEYYTELPCTPDDPIEMFLPINAGIVYPTRPNLSIDPKVNLPSNKSSTTLADLGGLDSHIQTIKNSVILPLLYPEFCQDFNVTPSRGVIFYGSPGTGKTMMARALADECFSEDKPVAFFNYTSADILSHWVGESELRIKAIFDSAALWQPSIVYFDEIDGLAPIRVDEDRPSASLVSSFLSAVDGFASLGKVLAIGSTNRLGEIDPALLRPGRFDEKLLFGLPNEKARASIISVHTRRWPNPPLPKFVQSLAEVTNGFNGADLSLLCSNAVKNAFFRLYPTAMDTNMEECDFSKIEVLSCDFDQALNDVVPFSSTLSNNNYRPSKSPFNHLFMPFVDQILNAINLVDPMDYLQSLPRIIVLNTPHPVAAQNILFGALHRLEDFNVTHLDLSSLSSTDDPTGSKALTREITTAISQPSRNLFVIKDSDTFFSITSSSIDIIREALCTPCAPGSLVFLFGCSGLNQITEILDELPGIVITADKLDNNFITKLLERLFEDYFNVDITPILSNESSSDPPTDPSFDSLSSSLPRLCLSHLSDQLRGVDLGRATDIFINLDLEKVSFDFNAFIAKLRQNIPVSPPHVSLSDDSPFTFI